MDFFPKEWQKYQHLKYYPGRSSSEDRSLSQLLEKEVLEIRQKDSFWQRHRPLIILHSVIFIFYVIFLYMVAASARNQALRGPSLVYCMFPVDSTRPVLAKPSPFVYTD